MGKPDVDTPDAEVTARCRRQIVWATIAAVVLVAVLWRTAVSRGWAPF